MNTQKPHGVWEDLNPGNAGGWKNIGEKVVGTCYSCRWDRGWQSLGLGQQSCGDNPTTQSSEKLQIHWQSNLPHPVHSQQHSQQPPLCLWHLCPVKPAEWWILTEMSTGSSCADHSPISCKGIPHHCCKHPPFSSFGEFHLACVRLSFS